MTEPSGRSPQIPGRARLRSRALQSAAVALAAVAVLTACASRPGTAVTTTPTAEPTPTATASVSPSATPSPQETDPVQPEPEATAEAPSPVTIVNVGADGRNISASGLVTGVTADGGECVLTATSTTGEVLTGSVEAVSTPAAVNCGLIDIAAPAGEWTLVLEYRSSATSAVSEPVSVTQP